MINDSGLTQSKLKSQLHYDPETGVFTRASVPFGSHAKVGDVAGSLHHTGYIRIYVFGKCYAAHRLAWLYMTGKWPKNLIDHKDMNRTNNAFTNLRDCTKSQNLMNTKKSKANKSGHKGVSWHKATKKWMTAITVQGKSIYLGVFNSAEDAAMIYKNYAKSLHGEFYREPN